MRTNSIIFLLISAFAFVPLFLAEFARKDSVNTTADFFLQRRKMGLFPMYATVYATWMSAFAFMGAISYFYEQGPTYMTTVGWDALFALLFYVVGRRIWFYGRKYHYVTPMDFFHDIYQNRVLDALVTGISLVFTMIYIELQLIGGLFLIQSATHGRISMQISGAIFFIVLITYLWAGGLRAVAMTDVFYGAMIIITIFLAGIFLVKVGGGAEHIFQQLMGKNTDKLMIAGPHAKGRAALWISLFLVVPIGAFMGPQMWIRCYAAKRARHFEVLPFLLFLSSAVFIGTMLAGCAGLVLFPDSSNTSMIPANLLVKYASPVFATLIFLGITAAIFSTANSMIHALSVVFTVDVYKRHIRPISADRSLLIVAKRTVLVISLLSYAILALFSKDLMNVGFYALSGTAQLIVPVVGALFWKRSSASGAVAGILSGLGIFLLFTLSFDANTSICGAVGLFLNALVFVTVSLAQEPDAATEEKIGAYRQDFSANVK